jgi:hypothetical protein
MVCHINEHVLAVAPVAYFGKNYTLYFHNEIKNIFFNIGVFQQLKIIINILNCPNDLQGVDPKSKGFQVEACEFKSVTRK